MLLTILQEIVMLIAIALFCIMIGVWTAIITGI